jgi:hypothetical protein
LESLRRKLGIAQNEADRASQRIVDDLRIRTPNLKEKVVHLSDAPDTFNPTHSNSLHPED